MPRPTPDDPQPGNAYTDAPTHRVFTEEEFLAEVTAAGFIGCYKFWTQISPMANAPTRARAEGVLKGLAQIVWERNGRCARSREEAEAFQYCGLH